MPNKKELENFQTKTAKGTKDAVGGTSGGQLLELLETIQRLLGSTPEKKKEKK